MPLRFRQRATDLTAPPCDHNDEPLTDDDGDFETEACLRSLTHKFTQCAVPG